MVDYVVKRILLMAMDRQTRAWDKTFFFLFFSSFFPSFF